MQQAAIPHNTPPLPPQRHTTATHLRTTMHNLNTTHATTCTPTGTQHAHHNTQVPATNQTTHQKLAHPLPASKPVLYTQTGHSPTHRSRTQHQVTDHKQNYIEASHCHQPPNLNLVCAQKARCAKHAKALSHSAPTPPHTTPSRNSRRHTHARPLTLDQPVQHPLPLPLGCKLLLRQPRVAALEPVKGNT